MRSAIFLICILAFCGEVVAHHSDAGMDLDSVVAVEGRVIEYSWRQPHAYIVVETQQGGESAEWQIEMGAPNVLSRRGWSADSLSVGDMVFARVHPMRNGRKYGKLDTVERTSGELISRTSGQTQVSQARAESLEGKWIADTTLLRSYPGGFDGFFNAFLQLTDKGQQAKDSYDPLSDENPESTCVGRPTPAALVSTSLYLMEIDMNDGSDEPIFFRSEWFDEERTIYMDGRSHPDLSNKFTTGHSIGHWEEDTLVIDTTNFENHRSPYQVGVPSGSLKHVVERYRLISNGARIALDFVLEDPEYLSAPLTHSRELIYSPHMEMFVGGCDPEITRRFVN